MRRRALRSVDYLGRPGTGKLLKVFVVFGLCIPSQAQRTPNTNIKTVLYFVDVYQSQPLGSCYFMFERPRTKLMRRKSREIIIIYLMPRICK